VEPKRARFRAVSAAAFLSGIVAPDLFLDFFSLGFRWSSTCVIARRGENELSRNETGEPHHEHAVHQGSPG
jgi:hypothetical protein